MNTMRWWLVIIILSLLPLSDFLKTGLPITHDGQDHVARIANFYQSLSEGNIAPRWAANLNWGYGHPILMFLYPLPSYIASLFHFIGFSFVDATKIVFAVSYIASIAAMFAWASAQFGNISGVVAAILYGFAPYRFVDLYVRGAIGEHVAFVWPPIVFWGFLQLARKKRVGGVTIAVAIAGLILSHNAISLMVLPLIIPYGLYLYFFEAKKRLRFLVHSSWFVVLGFMLSAFFWMPAFFEGKYTLRDIVTKGDLRDRFVSPLWFLYSSWNYGGGNQLSKALGFGQWLGIAGSIALLWRTRKKEVRWLAAGTLMVLGVSLFLMTVWSEPLWQWITLLQKFQFPWRLLTVSVIATSVLGALSISVFRTKRAIYVTCFVVSITIISTYPMWHAQTYSQKQESFYTGMYEGTTDTGESSPIWSVRFMERKPVAPIEVIDGQATLTSLGRLTTLHRYEITATRKTRIVDNTLYFPGWKVSVDGADTPIEFQDPNYRGLMTFWVGVGKHTVEVRFGETKLRRTANYASLLGLLLLIGTITIRNWIPEI